MKKGGSSDVAAPTVAEENVIVKSKVGKMLDKRRVKQACCLCWAGPVIRKRTEVRNDASLGILLMRSHKYFFIQL